MANALENLEVSLQKTFGEKARPMPKPLQLFLVEWAPVLSLVAGVLGLFSTLALWRWAHASNAYTDFAESTCVRYGGENCGVLGQSRLSFWVWLSLLALIVQSLLFVAAYAGLKERSKKGWNYLYYALLISVAVSVLRLFAGYSQFVGFLFALISAAIGCYILFQMRDHYLTESSRVAAKVSPKPAEPTPELTKPIEPTQAVDAERPESKARVAHESAEETAQPEPAVVHPAEEFIATAAPTPSKPAAKKPTTKKAAKPRTKKPRAKKKQ